MFQCVKTGCVAELAYMRIVRGDLYTVGNPLKQADLTWIMRCNFVDYDVPSYNLLNAVFDTWLEWWDSDLVESRRSSTIILPSPRKFDITRFVVDRK